jgi:protocatechuate 3,4-dioxygenase beta subunit
MKKLFILLVFGLTLFAFKGQAEGDERDGNKGSLTGRIVDSENLPLPGAAIMIKSLNKGTVSDNNGVYRLLGLNPGEYVVKF